MTGTAGSSPLRLQCKCISMSGPGLGPAPGWHGLWLDVNGLQFPKGDGTRGAKGLGRSIRRRWEFAKGFVSELIEIPSAVLRVLCHGLPVPARERVFALAERPIRVPARASAVLIPGGG